MWLSGTEVTKHAGTGFSRVSHVLSACDTEGAGESSMQTCIYGITTAQQAQHKEAGSPLDSGYLRQERGNDATGYKGPFCAIFPRGSATVARFSEVTPSALRHSSHHILKFAACCAVEEPCLCASFKLDFIEVILQGPFCEHSAQNPR
jgi:hypothetical protein